jgi:hypothetical protein
MREAMRSGWKGSSAVGLLADAEELDRLAGDLADRQRRTAAGVAVGLGQDHAGQRQRVVEGLGGLGGVLAGHAVDHEQRLDRRQRAVQGLDLGHHVGVDGQPAGGVDDQHVLELLARGGHRGAAMSSGFWSGVLGKKVAPTSPPTVRSCSMAAGR